MPRPQRAAVPKSDSTPTRPRSRRGGGGNDPIDAAQLLTVLTALRKGDFTARLPADGTGLAGKVADTLNDVIELSAGMTSELRRLSNVVGKEGRISQRAFVGGASGAWADCVEAVNSMVTDLVQPNTEVARVIGAVAKGDLSQTMALEIEGRPLTGEFLRTARTVNTMVEQLNGFASEVTRVAREVGTEGKLGGQAEVRGVSGTWKDLTDSVNFMASNLTGQVRNIAAVTTAVARGDLSKKITADARGEILELKETINTMVDQLSAFASEVTRVAREVGTEGKLGGQAEVRGVSGTWKDLTDNVNFMASNLTSQVRNIAEVTTAVANGDLSKKITVNVRGEILDLKNTINVMVDQLNAFASEVTRVAREVGTEGQLGGQAEVKGVAGTWKDLTDSVNHMAGNLTSQVRNIAAVTTAVAQGDLSKKITVDVRGEMLGLKDTINTMVDRLNAFASEVTRVAREVGTDGRLGGQAEVEGVSGTWKDLTDSVNHMAGNLTSQVRNIAAVTTAVANGDLSKKITVDVRGEILELKQTINTMVDQLNAFASEVTRVAREVGTEGQLGGQAHVRGVSGTWKDLTDNVNFMASNLTSQVRNIAAVTTAVANGDLSKKITVDVKGEILDLKNTINTMVDQLNAFASEVTRVAREVGTEGQLGGQAEVKGVGGTWKDLTDNVNSMAANLTSQVRGIAKVVTAVANGDLKQKLVFEAKGEIAELADTINAMTGTLATFAEQVTTVAREVGIEGKLGGQASVPGAAGTWRDLTDNVNRLAANLTTQVRAIATVATAVTKGDLSRSIAVDAAGEVAALKDTINEMIRNLKDTTRINTEQDWLKTNLAKFTRTLQGQRDLVSVARLILSELAPLVNAQHGLFYVNESQAGEADLRLLASYAHRERKRLNSRVSEGEGLVGQVAFEKERILLTDVPDDYIVPGEQVKIASGLGESRARNIVVLPVLFEKQVKAVIELASFKPFTEINLNFLDQLTESIGVVLNTLGANMRTEELLKQSQSLTQELQHQQQELQEKNERLEEQAQSLRESERLLKEQQEKLKGTNEDLEEKARLLAEQNAEVARKNNEIELARQELEEKAEQLALSSKYKSEFLANMSHELRTPLNSLLILSKLLSQNPEGNLTSQQVDYAGTIYSAGSDLLALINEILDLAKIESGTMEVDVRNVPFAGLKEYVERNFGPVALQKGLKFDVELAPELPPSIFTDPQRLQQVIRNLLSNAFKFTEEGSVSLRASVARDGWSPDNNLLNHAEAVIAFTIADTGIGIPADKHRVIFEAFQQADGTTSRKYGGTGLGLSISREIAAVLHGEITVVSSPGQGSTFTLFLPRDHRPSPRTSDPQPYDEEAVFRPARLADGRIAPPPTPGSGRGSRTPVGANGGGGNGAEKSSGTTDQVPVNPFTNPQGSAAPDDRSGINLGDLVLLTIDDDPTFRNVIADRARAAGFKVVVATEGETGLALARDLKPSAIVLDIRLPGMNGWAVLDRLKHDPAVRHIPVHVLTAGDEGVHYALKQGARRFVRKTADTAAVEGLLADIKSFLTRDRRSVLVVEDDANQANSIVELIGADDVATTIVPTGEAAIIAMRAGQFDCVVLDIGLPGMSGFEFVEAVRNEPQLAGTPIVVYTARDLTRTEQSQLRDAAEAVIVKDARSPERLLEETVLFLHRAEAELPPTKRKMLEQARLNDPALLGARVLIVDDDVRNVFALTAALEQRFGMKVTYADNGAEGIRALEAAEHVDVVLMDVMMPGMDGYETIRRIRQLPDRGATPIIALTAKAMKGDREKCLAAGASDYIAKPVDTDQLASLIRVWVGDRKPDPEQEPVQWQQQQAPTP
jgi:HAMP domain-containing protein/CheY-like chemotaxis protein/GAF domain-containing protein